MKKTLKATAVIVSCCVLMVVIIIYTPEPLEERHQRREKELTHLDEKVIAHLKLTCEAIDKVVDAIEAILDVHQRIHDQKADLKPLIEANIKAIEALTEAGEAVKSDTDELQRLNEARIDLNPLIKANTKLVAALTEVIKRMKALTEELQRFTKEKATPWPSHEAISGGIRKVLDATRLALNAKNKAIDVFDQYRATRRQL